MRSAFISYGGPDEKFASKVNCYLKEKWVKTFFFPLDAKYGEKLHHLMRDGVNSYDKVIFICSKDSLTRPGVINELEETLQREAREEGKQVLIPIYIDDYVFSGWFPDRPGLKQTILDRVVGNFRGTKRNKAKFIDSCNKLISALKDGLESTIISSHSTIQFDTTGLDSRISYERKFVAHRKMSEITYYGFDSTGRVNPISTSFGKLNPMVIQGGSKAITITFDKPLPINEIITHGIVVDHINAYTETAEAHSAHQTVDAQELSMDFYFPKIKPVKDVVLKCRYKNQTYILQDEIKVNNSHDQVKMLVKNPMAGAEYIIEWTW